MRILARAAVAMILTVLAQHQTWAQQMSPEEWAAAQFKLGNDHLSRTDGDEPTTSKRRSLPTRPRSPS
jgi:hypothetical protein